MIYKGLIFDLDGTAIPNKPDGMPSERLVAIVAELQNTMKVCAATGRPWFNSQPIIQKLQLHNPCIISGGAQIIDPINEKTLWEKPMSQSQVESIMGVARQFPYNIFFSDDEVSTPAKEKAIKGSERIIFIQPVGKEDSVSILEQLKQIPDVTAHAVKSWTPDHFDIHITHSEATKRHALQILLDLLGIHKEETVAAGDSNNDLPLFEIAGYKIAMANGSDALKAKADLIAPDVSEDGLATSLKDFLLKK